MSDGTEYLIDVASRMSSGDATISQLAELTELLTNSGASVGTLEAALAQANTALDATAAASAQAAAALEQSEAKYSQLEKAADASAKAVEKMAAQGKAVPPELQQRADAAAQALHAEAAALDAARSAAAAAAQAHEQAAEAASHLEDATKAAVDAETSLGEKLEGAASWAAEGATAVGGLSMAIGGLAVDAMHVHDATALAQTKLDALAGSTAGGMRVHAMLDGMAGKIGTTRQQLEPFAQQLLALGTPIDQLEGKVKALAAQQALGMGGDQAVLNVLTRLQEGIKLSNRNLQELTKSAGVTGEALAGKLGMSVTEFHQKMAAGTLDSKKMADAIIAIAGDKGMPALEQQAKSLDQKVKNVKNAFGDMVSEAINTDEATGALDQFSAMFDKNTASGKEMRAEIGGAFAALSSAAVAAAPVIVSAIETMAHGAEGLANILNKASHAFGDLEDQGTTKAVDNTEAVTGAGGKSQADQLAALEAQADQLAHKVMEANMNPFTAFSDDTEQAKTQLELLTGEIDQMKKSMAQDSGGGAKSVGAGVDVASGYAQGIRAGIPDAVAAAAEMGAATQAALKAANDSHSPSKKFEAEGLNVGAGYAGGIEKSGTQARSALSQLGGPVGGAAPGGAARAGVSLTGPFNFYGVEGAEDAERRFQELFTRAVEGDVQQLGGSKAA